MSPNGIVMKTHMVMFAMVLPTIDIATIVQIISMSDVAATDAATIYGLEPV